MLRDITWLKFEYLKGKKITSESLIKSDFNKRGIFEPLGYEEIFGPVLCIEKIEILKKVANSSVGPEKNKSGLSKREIAFVCIFKNVDLSDTPDCRIAIKKYNPNISVDQARDIRLDYLKYNKGGRISMGGIKPGNEKISITNGLLNIMPYLNDTEKKEAQNCFDKLTAKSN